MKDRKKIKLKFMHLRSLSLFKIDQKENNVHIPYNTLLFTSQTLFDKKRTIADFSIKYEIYFPSFAFYSTLP